MAVLGEWSAIRDRDTAFIVRVSRTSVNAAPSLAIYSGEVKFWFAIIATFLRSGRKANLVVNTWQGAIVVARAGEGLEHIGRVFRYLKEIVPLSC